VTVIDAVFAGYEDYKRHIADDRANSASARVFNRELREFEDVQWRDVQVGDFVKIANHETIPADVLILAVIPAEGSRSGGNTGVCYVETKNLDGETNLKLREAPRVTRHMFEAEEDAGEVLQGYLESEMPNGDINRYSGTLYIEENESVTGRSSLKKVDDGNNVGVPVSLKNMLLRGSKLRNTNYAYGLAVNTGVDSKIMMSSGDEFPVKISSIDEMTNKQVIIVVLLLVLMSMAGAVGDKSWVSDLKLPSDFDSGDISKSVIGTFVYFFTTLASMVPITLYVSITMVKALQAYFMERDLDMYDAENDVPMVARTMQLNEQLGQISHVFSDKTGTLTCNRMEFRKCSIMGKSYGKGTTAIGLAARMRKDFKGTIADDASDDGDDDEYMMCPAPNVNFKDKQLWEDMGKADLQARKISDFFRHLALCHGVLIERLDAQAADMEMPPIVYSASSPDEQALVSGAKYFGYEFVHREPGSVSIKTPDGVIEQYEILEVFEFDSTRKRMTVVVQKRRSDEELMQMTENDEEDVLVLCKGADSVLFPRLADTATNKTLSGTTLTHMEAFARDGLRTLVICSKTLKLSAWEEFHSRYRKVCSDLHEVEAKASGEANAIDTLQDELERELDLLGATAIEDRLQDGVPETMEQLAKAGICIWVLTGDMEETAINIGFACRLLNNDMQRHVINSVQYHSKGAILRRLDEIFHWINEGRRPAEVDEDESDAATAASNAGDHALVIDGASLNLVLEDPLYNLHLLRVSLLCKVVIACRVSPQQKAQLVELVKLNVRNSHTLSIGDGANDVPMIQSAHIGIGISGQEGMQAVNSSDYALGQFRFLSTLLLAHGRWNYDRVAGLTLYTFYKNIVYCASMFWYCMTPSAYSGTMIYSAFIQQGYNLFFTALPIMAFAVFDRDLPKQVVMEFPTLYHPATRERSMFTYKVFWQWIGLAIIDSIGVYLFTLAAASNIMRYGVSVEYTVLQTIAWTTLCIVVTSRYCLMVNSWDVFAITSIALSIIALYLFQVLIDMITWTSPDYDSYSFPWIFGRIQFWIGPLLAVVAIFIKDFFYEGIRRRFYPDYLDLVKEKVYLVNDADKDLEDTDDIKSYSPPMVSYMRPELVNMLDYRQRREQERAPVRFHAPGRSHLYSGFAFDQPAYVVNWILNTGHDGGISDAGPLRRKSMNPAVRNYILNSNDPVIFENERYQPFCGYGSTYPGYLLPTDRSRWSDRSGKISAMSIPLAGLELDFSVPGCDEDGWVYEVDFKAFSSVPPVKSNSGDDDEDAEQRSNPPPSRPSSKKAIGPMRGFVRRREWVLSERYKQLARERQMAAERDEEERQARL
jgi:phospholipid-transporting ATPase